MRTDSAFLFDGFKFCYRVAVVALMSGSTITIEYSMLNNSGLRGKSPNLKCKYTYTAKIVGRNYDRAQRIA